MYFKNGSIKLDALYIWNSKVNLISIIIILFSFIFRNPLYATRATLVSTEALKSRKMYNEAALQFIKLTSEVECQMIKTPFLDTRLLKFAASECFISRRGWSIKFRTYSRFQLYMYVSTIEIKSLFIYSVSSGFRFTECSSLGASCSLLH